MPPAINRDGAVREHATDRLGSHRRPPENRFDASDELADVERLREIVVGADLEADDLIDVIVTRRDHDDRHL